MHTNKKYWIYVGVLAMGVTAFALLGWRKKAARIAQEYENIRELGNNNGFANAEFEKMMREVGWKSGEAWCMYLVKAVYIKAFPRKADEIKKILTGSTQGSLANAKNNPEVFKVITDGPAKAGDIVIWQSTTNGSLGHAGIVLNKTGMWTGVTMEGNTSIDNVRDGDGVERKERDLKVGDTMGSLKVKAFIRLRA